MAYTVAEAEVRVLPNADNFGEALKAEIAPHADAIGRDAGDRIGKGIQERVRLALKELPDAKIGVDLDQRQLDTALAEIRAKTDAAGETTGRSMGQKLSKGAADEAGHGSPLIMAAVVGGLIAGGPLVVAAMGVVMGGIAGVIVHNAPEIQDATAHLLNGFTESFGRAAQITVPYFVEALDTVRDAATGLAAQAAPAFAALDKPIQELAKGVVALATNAMPGLVRSVTNGLPVFQGLDHLLATLGTGLSEMLRILTDHAGAAGTTLASLGDIIGTLLSALGTLAAEGAELGQAVLPALATVLDVLNTVLQAIAPVIPSIALGFAGWKIAALLAPMLGSLAASLEETGASAMVAVAELTGVEGAGVAAGAGFEVAAAGARGFQAAMGPIGWVLLAIGLAVPALVTAFHNEDASQKQVKASAEAMTQALQQSKGAIDENVRAQAALQAQKDGLFQWAATWGVSTSTVVNALLGQQGAMDEVTAAAHNYAGGQNAAYEANLNSGESSLEIADGYRKQADASNTALGSINSLSGTVKGEVANQGQLKAAIEGATSAAQENANRLAGIASGASAASGQINLLKGALDALTGQATTLDQAQIQVTQAIDNATQAAKNHTAALHFTNGELDLSSTKSATAAQMLIQLAGQQHNQIATMEQQGKSTAEVSKATEDMRGQFIKTARDMGATADQAKTLADRYFGIPTSVYTEVSADTSGAVAKLDSLKTRLSQLTNGKYFVNVYETDSGQHVKGAGYEAAGGVVHAYAGGGIEPSMAAGIAQIVAPQTYRVIGDRVTDDEAYIPINDSARSLSILAQTAGRMGFGLHRGGAAAATSKTDARSYHFTISAPSDPAAIAREIRDAQRDLEFLHG